jgi:GT2 family glycosyltransferase/2-polyprenyl-3-methyl-5-hydroxy-6-metoxy-1,4-benzoquinol methylase
VSKASLIGRAMYHVQKDETGYCVVCGRDSIFRFDSTIINAQLQRAWGISDILVESFNRKESMFCGNCGCSLRIRRLAAVLMQTFVEIKGTFCKSVVELVQNKEFQQLKIAEINACGALHSYLKDHPHLAYSEWLSDTKPGEVHDGVRCEDLQCLTYPDNSFDIILSSETLEHVPDPDRAWREINRTLKCGGYHVFTIPVVPSQRQTIQRAQLVEGVRKDVLEPAYHGAWSEENVFVYTDFGMDVVKKLNGIGLKTKVFYQNPEDELDVAVVFRSRKSKDNSSGGLTGGSNMLAWTGERYVPWIEGAEIGYEHLHRYAFATQFVQNKIVLDLASGEGYGSHLLARTAKQVVGIDIDENSIKHARNKYIKHNLQFKVGSITEVPIADDRLFDVAVCFEALEHIDEHEKLLREVKRLLTPDGLFIVSTPNKWAYSDEPKYENPFHVHELYFDEFKTLLESHFRQVKFLGQRIYCNSNMWPIFPEQTANISEFVVERTTQEFIFTESDKRIPLYFIAIASDAVEDIGGKVSVLVDISNELVTQKDTAFNGIVAERDDLKVKASILASERDHLAQEATQFQVTIRSQQEALTQRDERITELTGEMRKLTDDLAQIQAAQGNLNVEVTALRATLQQHQEAIISKDATLSHIYNSHGWKALSAYYEIRNKLLPEGSCQRAFAKRLFHSVLNVKRKFSQQGQFGTAAALPQEHKEVVTGEIVQSTGQVVQELITQSAIREESSWESYETLAGQISALRQTRLERLVLKRPKMVCIDETKLSRYAKSLVFTANDPVQVSIVIPVYNNLKFTLECLTSVMEHSLGVAYEVIVVDDGSSDQTLKILSLVPNITYIRNEANLGFIHACNRGAEIARGEYTLFLNNDAQVTENWLQPLIQTFGEYDKVGAVGPKILFPDGRLQEAGALINPDTASKLIGLLDDPDLPRYNYAREVMYCSGACLLVNARKFRELGGFDARLAPAYCEDWDLAFRLREQGLRIMYNPNSVVIHHLSVTANYVDERFKIECVVRNQQKLSQKWQHKIDSLNEIRMIVLYLPQFHPIAENDLWWGKGFTEWNHVARAKPNFVGHYQPHLPADLGFYDLRVEEIMDQQAELAKRYGIYGFCYFYYWFAGKRLLDLPLKRLLKTNKPNIPFCLCWANENWTRKWDGMDDEVLIAQQHSDEDDRAVIRDLMRYMRHQNYIRINGKPLLIVYRVNLFPDIKRTTEIWRDLCRKEGVGEIYLAMVESFELAMALKHPSKYGCDASIEFPPHGTSAPIKPSGRILNSHYNGVIHDYREAVLKYLQMEVPGYVRFRSVMPSWDNTPRRQNESLMFEKACPEAYQAWLEAILEQTHEQNFGDERIVFINAWNEWGEGNHLEPDRKYGHGFLEATRNAQDRWLLKRGNNLD